MCCLGIDDRLPRNLDVHLRVCAALGIHAGPVLQLVFSVCKPYLSALRVAAFQVHAATFLPFFGHNDVWCITLEHLLLR